MNILSYLFKKPQSGDKGSVFWPALEDDIQQMNDHSHNGTNSARLASSSVTSSTQSVSSASWSAQGGGTYRQLVTMPGSMLYDEYMIVFKHSTSKEQMFLKVEKVSSNTYYVYINDNSVSLTAYYLS
jgi:hypothetical protein